MTGIENDRFGNFRCVECQRFVSASEQQNGREIRHANTCESKAQPYAPKSPARFAPAITSVQRAAIRQGAVSQVLSDDEIVDAVKAGRLSISDAMNRDS